MSEPIALEYERMPDHLIWESKFSELVAATYGRPYQHQQLLLDGQNTYTEFEVPSEPGEPTEYERNQMAQWLAAWAARLDAVPAELHGVPMDADRWPTFAKMKAEREDWIDLDTLLCDLARRGLMKPGRYLMKTWW